MDQTGIRALTEADMTAVNALIIERLQSDVSLINQLGYYIISAGGKRMRPMLTVLAARALGYEGSDHLKLAAIIEFIHTSTLLHDDVVDESDLRRGRETANAMFGNAASVLVGDYLYSRSFQMMSELSNLRIMEILADATNTIAEGEVLQLMNCNDPDTTEESYMTVIYCKTAKLFEAATRLAAVLTHQSPVIEQAMTDYGKYLGTAFQIIDDVMDYCSDSQEMGKNVGDDLSEGKPTLPLLYAMAVGSAEERQIIREAIELRNGMERLDTVLAILERTGALDYARQRAREEADKAISALTILPAGPHREALETLAHMAVQRSA
ncbi:octaprenyl diphosphate synthase [Aeromonas schubertii]|uniref:Octaprenyl diphosphate synthase n=1 Tax=Aeromonas schubertii TaxID=652 RepID=A0A0S2SD26_9GAMM|nr:octaprenyl diphosphate synthase [Aeromonas schubertii]ALP39592.1 octaprenyl-diphosphate synthase [Aeromonas schubertii]KUE78111.1 octaprenyl diphosphate synthase [Aeromonas schubertii]MBZ6068087.1 octaprenyl diphosphate synthase [Aeromonas schubertii]